MNPKNISIKDYTYDLPEIQIAKFPLPRRDASRLLVYRNDKITETVYQDIYQYLPQNSLLVFNDTRVVEARIIFQKPTGAKIEIFCLEPQKQYADLSSAMLQKGSVVWMCLIGGASKWKPGQILEKKIRHHNNEITLQARYLSKEQENFAIELSWNDSNLTFAEILHYTGIIPLPPYLKRNPDPSDAERYQTIYAHTDGSVAAPTAGLHFTEYIFKTLDEKGISKEYITLHVGAGTFKPVQTHYLGDHTMHGEFIDISESTIEKILAFADNPITAVGTTSLRALESLFWMGVKCNEQRNIRPEAMCIAQWEVYEKNVEGFTFRMALQSLLQWMKKNKLDRLITTTQILIAPGYEIKSANALITNFHQPQSTLLLLVAAFIGPAWKQVYDHALKNNFRFLSYGDGCLLLRY